MSPPFKASGRLHHRAMGRLFTCYTFASISKTFSLELAIAWLRIDYALPDRSSEVSESRYELTKRCLGVEGGQNTKGCLLSLVAMLSTTFLSLSPILLLNTGGPMLIPRSRTLPVSSSKTHPWIQTSFPSFHACWTVSLFRIFSTCKPII